MKRWVIIATTLALAVAIVQLVPTRRGVHQFLLDPEVQSSKQPSIDRLITAGTKYICIEGDHDACVSSNIWLAANDSKFFSLFYTDRTSSEQYSIVVLIGTSHPKYLLVRKLSFPVNLKTSLLDLNEVQLQIHPLPKNQHGDRNNIEHVHLQIVPMGIHGHITGAHADDPVHGTDGGAAREYTGATAYTCPEIIFDGTEVGIGVAVTVGAAEYLREKKMEMDGVIAAFVRDYSCLTRQRLKIVDAGSPRLTLDFIFDTLSVTVGDQPGFTKLDRDWLRQGCPLSGQSSKFVAYRTTRSPAGEAAARLSNEDYRFAYAPEYQSRHVLTPRRIECVDFPIGMFALEPAWDRTRDQSNCHYRVAEAASVFAKSYNTVIAEARKRDKNMSCTVR
jgi:hypothetical protein